jgi:hypothetical protein
VVFVRIASCAYGYRGYISVGAHYNFRCLVGSILEARPRFPTFGAAPYLQNCCDTMDTCSTAPGKRGSSAMKTRLGTLYIVSVLIGVAAHAEGATYYVAKNGNDGTSCAAAQAIGTPKQTLNNAVGCLLPGDTLLVRAGTYAESLFGVVPAGTSWTSKVRIAAYPGETVWMAPGTDAYRVLDFSRSQQYIEFDGINLDGSNVQYDTVKINAGSPGHNAHHIRIMNADVTGPRHGGSGGPTGQTFLAAAGDTTSIGGNEFLGLRVHGGLANDFDHSFYIQSAGNLIEGCDIYDFPGGGVQLYNGNGLGASPDNNVVRNNRIHDARRTVSGQRHVGIVTTGTGNKVYNNIIYNVPSDGATSLGISVYEGSVNTEIYNNTVYNAVAGIVVDVNARSTVVRNNIAYVNSAGNFRNDGSTTTESNNLFGTNPLFVNPSAGNFELQTGSPAVDFGTSISMVTTDIIGKLRPQGRVHDIGAYELGGLQTSAPQPPTGLRIVTN